MFHHFLKARTRRSTRSVSASPSPSKRPLRTSRPPLNREPVAPFPSKPWVTADDVEVQVTWTVSNLDPDPHTIEILIDPWNEFGRYVPGVSLIDANNGEFLPNLSGIDELMIIPGTKSGDASRIHGTFTFQDLKEVAVDFATVYNILQNAQAPAPGRRRSARRAGQPHFQQGQSILQRSVD